MKKLLKNKLVRILLFITLPFWILPLVFLWSGFHIWKEIWLELNKDLDLLNKD